MTKQLRAILIVSSLVAGAQVINIDATTTKLHITVKEPSVAKNDVLDAIFDDAEACGMMNSEIEKTSATEEFVQNMGATAYAKWVVIQKHLAAAWAKALEQGTVWAHYGASFFAQETN